MKTLNHKKIFEKYHVKNTKQRSLVLDVLSECDMPIPAEQIFLQVKQWDESISLSTVYRILDIFKAKNLVVKSTSSLENKAVFQLNRSEHKHYLLCTECKLVLPIEKCPMNLLQEQIQLNTGFQITGHSLEIYGKCQSCQVN